MPWVRRTRHLAVGIDGDSGVVVRSLLTGSRVRLTAEDLAALVAVPARTWVWRGDALAERLAADGLLVSDEPSEPFVALRARDDELTALGWWPDAAALHLGARWEGAQARIPERDGALPPRAYVGDALPAFPVRGGERTELPPADDASPLRELLARRRTVRTFDGGLDVDVLSPLLRWVWGAHGMLPLAGADMGLRRTSPSGGSLHPIEVYPIVRDVRGLAPGVYHYLGGEHALELVRSFDSNGVGALLERALAGQWFFAEAPVAFVMTARFGRSFRKYRRHAKIYRAIFLDAGHLSQTFYLLCTELGLGPWVTAALDESVIEDVLELDSLSEGVIAVCGCGPPGPSGPLEPVFTPL